MLKFDLEALDPLGVGIVDEEWIVHFCGDVILVADEVAGSVELVVYVVVLVLVP